MADSYHIIDGKVVPYSGGRKCNDTDAWRDATPLELQLQEQLAEYEHATAAKDAEIDALRTRLEDTVRDSTNKIEALRAEVERSERYAEQSERERLWAEDRADKLAEALRDAEKLLKRTPKATRHMYVGSDTIGWGVQAGNVLAMIRAALAQEDRNG